MEIIALMKSQNHLKKLKKLVLFIIGLNRTVIFVRFPLKVGVMERWANLSFYHLDLIIILFSKIQNVILSNIQIIKGFIR